ncbi:Short-chain dehydrogenase/reductase SDR [Penicillium chermesinum]|uniref:Short-chain dehydrogenase/reductase SDR n=1 Tax=Penicillium chermesinum TaxID=63820 RepID=A0A9W9TK54_9EURO|nr:Short-chain dehydrogenase/reductase SDR [Penicillium chermesinum]KAJ5225797.1 Short-chain dehydrogenase/reductase SDR [Penicillium chermesinum]
MASPGSQDDKHILVTGANSGLGFSICCRLADEFLATHPTSGTISVIFTTRSTRKAEDTRRRLEAHVQSSAGPEAQKRVHFVPELVDLSNLLSVRSLSRRLLQNFPKLDAIVLNAGLGGWSGIDWPRAVFGVLTDLLHQVTWPCYKIARVGCVTEKQTKTEEEPPLGEVFCANVLGHYMLAHNVVPLLKKAGAPDGPGRIVWISSIEATHRFFNVEDIQGLRSHSPYESSKALTDILALTSNLPSVAPWAVDSFLSDGTDRKDVKTEDLPVTYVAHPGICATAIVPLALPLMWAMVASFAFARLLGSPWHPISTYLGACAPVFLALAAKNAIEAAEAPYQQAGGGRAKWGSTSTLFGTGGYASTETDGWGHGGVVGRPVVEADRQRQRKRGAIDLTREDKEYFVELGRQCWKQMEQLRVQWEGILDRAEKSA